MATSCLIVSLIALLAIQAYAHEDYRDLHAPRFVFGRPPGGFLEGGFRHDVREKNAVKVTYPDVKEFYITQKLDHFNKSDARTWQQRVQFNNKSSAVTNDLVFVMIGGESAIGEKWVGNENVQMMRWAKKFGASAYQLEHRFFGKSRPFPTMTTEALVYCTTEQALADLAEFIHQLTSKLGYKNPRIVTFGGSYPGSLSAWFREKYPDLAIGGVASSAPLNLKLDFYEYSLVVEKVILDTNTECHKRVQAAVQHIEKLILTSAGRLQLNQRFNIKPAFDDTNVTPQSLQMFMSGIFGMFQGIVQYSYDGRDNNTMNGMNIRGMCNAIVDADANDKLAQIRAGMDFLNRFYPHTGSCTGGVATCTFDNSYADFIKLYGNVTYDESTDIAAYRGWMWLCCNEIGFLQTLDGGKTIFGSMLPFNLYVDMCFDMFGPTVTMNTVAQKNAAAQKYYGGALNYKATNVILPNGSIDPWHALGTYVKNETVHQIPLLIQGTAHCADMYPSYPNEPATLVAARQAIEDQLTYYINQKQSP